MFEKQAISLPNNIAVVYKDDYLTYGQLNEKSNSLAKVLIESGVTPEIYVGLLAERSIDYLIAVLAILKAGGVYLPLDPSYPSKRLYQILEQSQPKFNFS